MFFYKRNPSAAAICGVWIIRFILAYFPISCNVFSVFSPDILLLFLQRKAKRVSIPAESIPVSNVRCSMADTSVFFPVLFPFLLYAYTVTCWLFLRVPLLLFLYSTTFLFYCHEFLYSIVCNFTFYVLRFTFSLDRTSLSFKVSIWTFLLWFYYNTRFLFVNTFFEKILNFFNFFLLYRNSHIFIHFLHRLLVIV